MRNSNQKGIALVMALIMLLVITVLGVSAARMSGLDTQLAGNSMYRSMVFQGAESALSSATSDFYPILKSVESRDDVFTVPGSYFPVETVNGGVALESSATIKFLSGQGKTPNDSVGNDSEFEYQVLHINGTSELVGTAASDTHIQGIAIQKAQ